MPYPVKRKKGLLTDLVDPLTQVYGDPFDFMTPQDATPDQGYSDYNNFMMDAELESAPELRDALQGPQPTWGGFDQGSVPPQLNTPMPQPEQAPPESPWPPMTPQEAQGAPLDAPAIQPPPAPPLDPFQAYLEKYKGIFQNVGRTPEDKQDALRRAALVGGLSMLANNRGNYGAAGPAIGAGGLAGYGAYEGYLSQQEQARRQEMQDKLGVIGAGSKLDELMADRDVQKAMMETGGDPQKALPVLLQRGNWKAYSALKQALREQATKAPATVKVMANGPGGKAQEVTYAYDPDGAIAAAMPNAKRNGLYTELGRGEKGPLATASVHYGAPMSVIDRKTNEPVLIQPSPTGGRPSVVQDYAPMPKTGKGTIGGKVSLPMLNAAAKALDEMTTLNSKANLVGPVGAIRSWGEVGLGVIGQEGDQPKALRMQELANVVIGSIAKPLFGTPSEGEARRLEHILQTGVKGTTKSAAAALSTAKEIIQAMIESASDKTTTQTPSAKWQDHGYATKESAIAAAKKALSGPNPKDKKAVLKLLNEMGIHDHGIK